MPDTAERTPLEIALSQACEFAIAHGVEPPITPDDFGIQRSSAGWQHATYVDASHAVSVTIDPHGDVALAIAELWWIHDQADEERDPCDRCEGDAPEMFRGRPLVDVYLPGDAPAEAVTVDA